MFLDYDEKTGNITVRQEINENFVDLQEKTGYDLCPKAKRGNYCVPFVAFPILMKAIKKCEYPCVVSDNLKKFYSDFKARREILRSLKERKFTEIGSESSQFASDIDDIVSFIRTEEEKIKNNFSGFTGFYGNQIDTIIYGVIGKRVVIANDIGTGKTLVSILIAKYFMERKGMGKTLIMLPASLAKNFYEDYNKFYKDHEMLLVGSETRDRRFGLYQTFRNCQNVKFLITNYEKCRIDSDELSRMSFDIVIVDEFHKMKNFKEAEMSKNFFMLVKDKWKPKCVFPMSGTPIENRLLDIFPVFKLVDGGHILGGEKFFDNNFIEYEQKSLRIYNKYIGRYIEVSKKQPIGFKNHNYVKSLIEPYVIRKKLDLPAGLYRSDVMITPTKKFLEKYDDIKRSYEGSARYHAVRQFLCVYDEDNPKFEELENIVSQTSSKVLIFSFYKCSIDATKEFLESKGYKCLTCMGGDGTDPLDVVKQFRDDKDVKCLITTDKINYGHNIQFAKIIIEWEKPIKPTTSMQRIGRCYRSGQQDDVHAYAFVVKGTVEEVIHDQLEIKKDVIEKVIESLSDGNSDTELDGVENDIKKAVMKSLNINLE